VVTSVSPSTVNRAVCYCDDCQAFLHHLGRADLLDAHGGIDIVQVAPARLSFVHGQERIVGLRLTSGGLRGVKPIFDTRMLGAWQHKRVSCNDHARFSNGLLIK